MKLCESCNIIVSAHYTGRRRKERKSMLIQQPSHLAYSAMGNGRSDYDAYYGITEMENYFGWHFHDFYEFYIHLGGAEYYCIESRTYIMEPNQLFIIPPYTMHGLMADKRLKRYERAYIYLSSEFMKTLSLCTFAASSMSLSAGSRWLMSLNLFQGCTSCLSRCTFSM